MEVTSELITSVFQALPLMLQQMRTEANFSKQHDAYPQQSAPGSRRLAQFNAAFINSATFEEALRRKFHSVSFSVSTVKNWAGRFIRFTWLLDSLL